VAGTVSASREARAATTDAEATTKTLRTGGRTRGTFGSPRSKEEDPAGKRANPYYVPLDQQAPQDGPRPRDQPDAAPPAEADRKTGSDAAPKQSKRKPGKQRKRAGKAIGSPRSRDEEPRPKAASNWLQNLDHAIRMPSFGCHYVAVDRELKPNERRNSKADDSLPGIAIVIPADIFFKADIQSHEDIIHFLGLSRPRSDSREDRR